MRFQFEQMVELPRADVFAFHEDPEHLALLHQGRPALRMIHHDGCLHRGSRTWFEMTVAGILPVAMGFEHSVHEPPQRFEERLIHGPFSKFRHAHEFDEVNSGTVVRDVLEIELPWYYGGEWAVSFFVAPILQRAFRFRGEALQQLARTGSVAQLVGQQRP